LILVGHDNLKNYYKTNFAMMQFHHYTLGDLEGMLPWERIFYVDLLHSYVKSENERKRDAMVDRQAQLRQAQNMAKIKPAKRK
jgi:hypothetical protein